MASFAQVVPHPGPINSLFIAARRDSDIRAGSGVRAVKALPNLSIEIDDRSRTLWCFMQPQERPSFTPAILADLAEMQRSLKLMFSNDEAALRYCVFGSRMPGIYNLGGDLTVLAGKIRQQDRPALVRYARACIDVLYNNSISFNLPVVTIAMVQGDALGGGFEAALSCDVIVAERGARFGFPEVLFNLFPGMGAYSFLSRRIGAAKAEKMILSGKVYTAEELFAMDLVQVIAEPGLGEEAVRDFIDRSGRRHNAQSSIFQAGRRASPLSYDELRDIADLWVDAALRLREIDLRKMERLTSAQNRRWSGPVLSAAE